MTQQNAVIAFFLDGERYALRQWSHVPRVGDEVMLGAGRDRPGEKMACRVVRVVWGVEAETDPHNLQFINIEIERV